MPQPRRDDAVVARRIERCTPRPARRGRGRRLLVTVWTVAAICSPKAPTLGQAPTRAPDEARFAEARARGARFEQSLAAMQRLLHVWLTHADPRTLLLPDRIPGGSGGLPAGDTHRLYTPHNSGADLYPYLVLTAQLTDPDMYRGRMLEMLRNEVRYTTVQDSIPANLELSTGELGPPSLFGAGEYAKDGLLAVTEYLGRTPWTPAWWISPSTRCATRRSTSRFGPLPASDSELNGDYLQVLVRLETMTGDRRFIEWARRIGDAYVEEVLPGNHGVPSMQWNFATHTGDGRLRLRDHGNEIIVGLTLQFALETAWQTPRAVSWRPVIGEMLDRVLASANADGLLYDEIDAATLAPRQHAAVRQLGVRVRRRLCLLPGHRRHEVSRCGAPCAQRAPALSQLRVGTPAARSQPAARIVRRLRRHDRERHLPGEPRTGSGGPGVDRIRDGRDARRCSGRMGTSRTGTAKGTSIGRRCCTR